MRKTKSDWYTVTSQWGTVYKIEIFGVTKTTKHCMRLLNVNGKELEVFHLNDLMTIKIRYNLFALYCDDVKCLLQRMPVNRYSFIKTSKQLQSEGKSIIPSKTTTTLINMLKRRRNDDQ